MGLKVDLGNGVKSDVGNNGGYQLLGQAASKLSKLISKTSSALL